MQRTLKTALTFLLCASVSSAALRGAPRRVQERQPTFTSKTALVTINVIALGRDGKPVPGLAADDFEVKINGRVQPVQAVAYLDVPDATLKTPAASTDTLSVAARRTAVNTAPPRDARVFVVVIDDLSFEAGQGKALFVSAEGFVARLPPGDYAGFALTSGAQTINPSRDRRPVLSALKRAVGQMLSPTRVYTDPPIVGIGEAMQIEGGNNGVAQEVMLRECLDPKMAAAVGSRGIDTLTRMSSCTAAVPFRANQIASQIKAMRQRQIQSLTSLIASLGSVAGVKHVVLLSNGFAVTREVLDFQPIARAAAVAGVQLSTMVQEGDIDLSDIGSSVGSDNGSSPVSPGQAQRRREDDIVLIGGAQTMTNMAGGQFYRVIGQPLRFFERVATSASAVYRLGVALPAGLAPGKPIDVTASVKRAGVSALTSQHSAAPIQEAPLSVDEQVKNALDRGETRYGVPIQVAAIVRRSATAGLLEIGTTASTPATTAGPVNFSIGLVDGNGALRTGKRSVNDKTSDYRATFAFPVTPGPHQVRIAASDASGNVGAVTLAVNAALTTIETVDASDVLLWATDAQGNRQLLPFEDLPDGLTNLTVMVELYSKQAQMQKIDIRFSIVDDVGRVIAEKAAAIASGANGVARADAPFELTRLAQGRYTLRASVVLDGKPAGDLSTSFQRR